MEGNCLKNIVNQYTWDGTEHCDVAAKFRTCVLKLPGSNLSSDIRFLTETFRIIPYSL
jgi:hypothetical protein